jgi:hypothetical protein
MALPPVSMTGTRFTIRRLEMAADQAVEACAGNLQLAREVETAANAGLRNIGLPG